MYGMPTARDRYVTSLENQVEALKQKVASLETELSEGRTGIIPTSLRLTAKEATLLKTLYERPDVVRKEVLWDELYALLPNGGPEPKIIDVFICKMRRKLRSHGITIETVWGRGYRLPAESKKRLEEIRTGTH